MAITAPATSSTLAVADGKTLTANKTLTLDGTDSTTMTFPTTSATIARTDAAQTFTGTQTFGEVILGTNAAKVFNSGGVSIGNTTDPGATNLSVTGNVVIATSGKGIDFSATPGTGTSELFADYEEGTWTPSIGGLATYTARTGTYTKVGRLVTIQGDITINLILTGSIYTISGLPFTAGAQQWGSVGGFTGLNTGNIVFISCYVDSGTTNLSFNGLNAAGVTSGLLAPFKNSAQIAFSISYYV
jgi:hypothetical protein